DVGNASLTLNNVVLTNNVATADGGGVVFENTVNVPWTFTANNSVISYNHAGDAGGGIDEDGMGKVFINAGTVITGNTSVNQGAGNGAGGVRPRPSDQRHHRHGRNWVHQGPDRYVQRPAGGGDDGHRYRGHYQRRSDRRERHQPWQRLHHAADHHLHGRRRY